MVPGTKAIPRKIFDYKIRKIYKLNNLRGNATIIIY